VGDAVLDLLITQYIFSDKAEQSPGELTNMRMALVNNKFFSHLAVKIGIHKFIEYASQSVFKELGKYLEFHEKNSPDIAYLGLPSDSQTDMDDFEIEPPKFIADLFESVAGAMFLDSNGSLKTVWEVFYKFFKPYLSNLR
jgi:endoribonuclease Dicer